MATDGKTQEWRLTEHLDDGPVTPAHFELAEVDVEPLAAPGIKIELTAVSVDPYMRGAMRTPSPGYYGTSFTPGQPPFGFVIGTVVESNVDKFAVGDTVRGGGKWRKVQNVPAEKLDSFIRVDLAAAPAPKWLGVLGLTGLSSWLPIDVIGQPKSGEHAFVSGAAGAVGSAAVQILKALGVNVIGSAGSDAKVERLRELGIAAFNYKTSDTAAELRAFAPGGLDIYFDNVGGPTLDAALDNMRKNGRIIACGQISQYHLSKEERYGLKNTMNIVGKSLTFRGFIVTDWLPRFGEATAALVKLVQSGQLVGLEHIVDGFDKIPEAFIGLFSGANTGKTVVTV